MKTVCLVDDDDVFKMIFRKGMEISGLKNPVLEFNDGSEALKHFKTVDVTLNTPEVIFLDINMHDIDGWEFITKFQTVKMRFTVKIDIYVVSNSLMKNDIERARKSPDVVDYIIKPIPLNKIKAILQ